MKQDVIFMPVTKARIERRTQNMSYLLILNGNHGYANAPQSSVLSALPLLYSLVVGWLYVTSL